MKDKTQNEGLLCYTIGHSSHDIPQFIHLLKQHDIKYIVDVRSSPYSQHVPQFNREMLKISLEEAGLGYIYMGDSLGARYTNPELFFDEQNIVDFKKVEQLASFKAGIERVMDGLKKGHKLSLMCAEKDPFDCHRFVLVSHALTKAGIRVLHIRENGELEKTESLEKRLLAKYKINYKQSSLFEEPKTEQQAVEEAYVRRNLDVGYGTEDGKTVKERVP